MPAKFSVSSRWVSAASVLFLCSVMFVISRHNYLLFHSTAEVFSIVVACGIFMVAWNSREYMESHYLLFLGIAYIFIGMIDFTHVLAYKGMGTFGDNGSNLTTQLWISARYVEAGSLFIAPFFLNKEIRPGITMGIYSVITVLIFLSLFTFKIFPDCYIEGQGLTLFKKVSEYIISVILIGAVIFVYRRREDLDTTVFDLVVASIIITIFSELAFTFYISVYGLSNLVGHLLKIVSYYLIYKAVIETGLKRPYDLLFRDLKKSEEKLLHHKKNLEEVVRKRTRDLKTAYENLRQDMAKRKKLEEQLRQTYKMESLGTLAGGIAHDFNNILGSVIGYAELAMDQVKKSSPVYEDMSEVLSAAKRARDLIDQILTFSRQEQPDPQPTRVRPIIKEVLKLIRASLPSSIRFEENLKGDPLIMADSTKILQVLMNLCANAGHAMREKGGTLLVELESITIEKEFSGKELDVTPGPYVRLVVSDTGCGMTEEVRRQIFDPFYTTKPREEGTGMGLSVVHGIVAGFGGTILVHSEPGRGSSFRILFPAIERRSDADGRKGAALPGGEEHILFVDDEEPVCRICEKILRSIGYKVTSLTSSVEAIDLFQDKKDTIDLVITDIKMPDMTGLQLAEKLIEIKPEIPIILCSGFSSTVYEQQVRDIGVRAHLTKPVMKEVLCRTIRKVLDGELPERA